MVSQLSARLLGGYSDISSDTSSTSSSSMKSRSASPSESATTRRTAATVTQMRTQIKDPACTNIINKSSNAPQMGRFIYSTKSIARSIGGSSGYCADIEPALKHRTSPYNLDSMMSEQKENKSLTGIDLVYHKGKTGPSDHNERRRKREEMNYAASNVRVDLAKGGITFPSVFNQSTKRPRVFPPGAAIDMSGVSILSAKDVNTPFLTDLIELRDEESCLEKEVAVNKLPTSCYSSFFEEPIILASNDVKTVKDMQTMQAYECISSLKSLIKSCSHMYELGINDETKSDYNGCGSNAEEGIDANGNRSDSESSTSSVTVANSDDMLPKPSQKRYQSIGEALSISNNAR
jgi:hypothetical protein